MLTERLCVEGHLQHPVGVRTRTEVRVELVGQPWSWQAIGVADIGADVDTAVLRRDALVRHAPSPPSCWIEGRPDALKEVFVTGKSPSGEDGCRSVGRRGASRCNEAPGVTSPTLHLRLEACHLCGAQQLLCPRQP
eukprot:4297267-Prymnesium_polylepis.4